MPKHPPLSQVGGQAVLGRQLQTATPWLTERHGYDPTSANDFTPSRFGYEAGRVNVDCFIYTQLSR